MMAEGKEWEGFHPSFNDEEFWYCIIDFAPNGYDFSLCNYKPLEKKILLCTNEDIHATTTTSDSLLLPSALTRITQMVAFALMF